MTLKYAILETYAIDVCCPHCFELVEGPDGSLAWTGDQLNFDDEHVCQKCGEHFQIPNCVPEVDLTP